MLKSSIIIKDQILQRRGTSNSWRAVFLDQLLVDVDKMVLSCVNYIYLRFFKLLHNIVVTAAFLLEFYEVFDTFFKLMLEKIVDSGDFLNKFSDPSKGIGGVTDIFNEELNLVFFNLIG